MTVFVGILLFFLIVCAASVSFFKNLLYSVLVYMSFSLIMSIVWVCLESPDLAVTEAAVGAGITSLLFFATLKKIQAINIEQENEQESEQKNEQTAEAGLQEAENNEQAVKTGRI